MVMTHPSLMAHQPSVILRTHARFCGCVCVCVFLSCSSIFPGTSHHAGYQPLFSAGGGGGGGDIHMILSLLSLYSFVICSTCIFTHCTWQNQARVDLKCTLWL